MPSITLDTNIIIDFLEVKRPHHQDAVEIINNKNLKLFITETVIKEIKGEEKLAKIQELIGNGILTVLDEPQMGFAIPTAIPIDMSHISPDRDAFIDNYLAKHPGKEKYKVLRDFLIAEAHKRNNNDYLLTNNMKDFYENLDIQAVDYSDLFIKLKSFFT
jgi:predicted nucleic acid-binding protein